MLINFVDTTNNANHYTKLPPWYMYWYRQYFIAKVFLLVLTVVFTSIANIPGIGLPFGGSLTVYFWLQKLYNYDARRMKCSVAVKQC